MKLTREYAAVGLVGVVAGSAMFLGAASGTAQSEDPFGASFAHPQPNPYFPLTPGLVLHYRGTDGHTKFRERVAVTHNTKIIQGVRAVVVRDVLHRADGTVAEATRDWYADDNEGNAWYLGEATATYDRRGHVDSREGSWQAGVKGATAGMIMPDSPKPTNAYRQEYWRGHAEDQAWIVQNRATVTVPKGTYHRVVRSYEWSRLEKANVSVKFYAEGVGIVTEHDVSGGTESFKLVRVERP